MRWVAVAVVALLLAGCASPKHPAAASPSGAPAPAAVNVTAPALSPLRFAVVADAEAELPLEFAFAPTDPCPFYGVGVCNGEKTADLTAAVPHDVPVELSILLNGNGNFQLELDAAGTTVVQENSGYSAGNYHLDAVLVRTAAGTVGLRVHYFFPSGLSAAGATLKGTAHSNVRPSVVPNFVPVQVTLNPGETINATGDGLTQLVIFPPHGKAIQVVQEPFSMTVPANGTAGPYILLASSDEGVHLTGPANRTLTARGLAFTRGDLVDVAANQDAEWDFAVAGQPIQVGIEFYSKETAGGFAAMAILGSNTATLTSPDNVDVLDGAHSDCTPWCDFTVLGNFGDGYSSDILDEHLVPGQYHAKVHVGTTNGMQAYAWAQSIV